MIQGVNGNKGNFAQETKMDLCFQVGRLGLFKITEEGYMQVGERSDAKKKRLEGCWGVSVLYACVQAP